MANRQYDVSVTDFDLNEVTGTDAGTLTNDLLVVVKEGAKKSEVVQALQAITAGIAADQLTIN
jgi:hypothetical protein